MHRTSSRYYLPHLDGLRFIAFLMVFFAHSGLRVGGGFPQSIKSFGGFGVDFFFVIGAYIFTKLFCAEWNITSQINLRYFYTRRVLRIIPLYYVYLCGIFLFYGNSIDWSQATIFRAFGLLTFTDNLLTAWWSVNNLPSVTHLWTISWEMQLYLVLPGLFYFLVHLTSQQKFWVCLFLAVVAAILRYRVLNMDYNNIFMFLVTRPDSVLVGMLLAFATESSASFSKWQLRGGKLLWFGAVVLATIMVSQGPIGRVGDERMLYLTPVFAIIFGGILIVTSRTTNVVGRFVCSKAMRYLGKISYGLYVYHIVCNAASLWLLRNLGLNDSSLNSFGLLLFTLSLVFTIMISSVSYYVIERPFLKIKERFTIVKSHPA